MKKPLLQGKGARSSLGKILARHYRARAKNNHLPGFWADDVVLLNTIFYPPLPAKGLVLLSVLRVLLPSPVDLP